MTVTVVRDKGVTVVTVAADEKSMLPPLCQILKTLCYSPMCCSVNKALMLSSTCAALGTIQIMVGLFNLGLGPGRTSLSPDDFAGMGAAYWLGAVFVLAGIMTLLADRFPAMFLVVLAVLVNLIGSALAIFGIVLYALDIANTSAARLCDGFYGYAPVVKDDNCIYVAQYYQRLVMAMDISMIVLVFLQLLVCISITVLGIRALFYPWSEQQDNKADEVDKPLLKDVLMTSPGA